MNILFYCDNRVTPHNGGTERATLSVARCLHDVHGHTCYCLYSFATDEGDDGCFPGEMMQMPLTGRRAFLRQYVTENNIHAVIIQGNFQMACDLRQALPPESPCRIIMAHHYAPGWETRNCTLSNYWQVLHYSQSMSHRLWYAMKCAFHPFFRYRDIHRLRQLYHEAYDSADITVLLSESYKAGFMDFGRLTDDTKFRFVPNMLTFAESLPADTLHRKQKRVLIVSRLEEASKRLSLALDVWKHIKSSPISEGWTLDIVGSGPDEGRYRRMVAEHSIPDVAFHGRQNPRSFYERSSLFMMTSRSEAWPLTLTESLQMGVVPVVFDSFSALHDVITHKENGIIVADNAINAYVESMLMLMNDTSCRQRLAERGMASISQFSSKRIGTMWHNLILSLSSYPSSNDR